MANWDILWTGSYPNLCSGKWVVLKDGELVDLSTCPFVITHKYNDGSDYCIYHDAETLGTYRSWHFEDWIEVFDEYVDGRPMDKWIEKYQDWLREIDPSGEDWETIYKGFQAQDWRKNSCGGCI